MCVMHACLCALRCSAKSICINDASNKMTTKTNFYISRYTLPLNQIKSEARVVKATPFSIDCLFEQKDEQRPHVFKMRKCTLAFLYLEYEIDNNIRNCCI